MKSFVALLFHAALALGWSAALASPCIQEGGSEPCQSSRIDFSAWFGGPGPQEVFAHGFVPEQVVDAVLAQWSAAHPTNPRFRVGLCSPYVDNGVNTFHPHPWIRSLRSDCPINVGGFATAFGGATCSPGDAVEWNANGQPPYCVPPISPANVALRDICCGNPITPATAAKVEDQTDYSAAPFTVSRTYHSRLVAFDWNYGGYWAWSFNSRIEAPTPATVIAYRSGGGSQAFVSSGGTWQPAAGSATKDRLERLLNGQGVFTGWRYADSIGDNLETYDTSGRLLTIEKRNGELTSFAYSTAATPPAIAPRPGLLIGIADAWGRALSLAYFPDAKLKTITLPGGLAIAYLYDGAGNLVRATYPDGKFRVYVYNEQAHTSSTHFPNALTGIIDENGVRYATFKYDTQARATLSERAGGVNRYSVAYGANSATVTEPLETVRTYAFQTVLGLVRANSNSQPPGGGAGTRYRARTFDANSNVASETDFNGVQTTYAYDLARNLETQRTEAFGTPQARTISTQWHATWRVPVKVAEPLRITTITRDTRGNVLTREVQATTDASGAQGFSATSVGAPRTWAYTYNAFGRVLTEDGPRTDAADVTTYAYYANDDPDFGKRGNLATVTNALGHVTSISAYNAHGQPLTIVDPNGVTTTLAYDARQRLTSRTLAGETTTYDYDGVGQVAKVTLTDGSFLQYTYDNAHRLTAIQDNLGNKIAYTLDAMGNRTAEQVRDPADALVQTRSRVYSNLNRLTQELGAAGQTTEYAYDDQGNLLTVKDPLNRVTANQYDALNRLKLVTSPTPISAVTLYAYNGLDQLVSVTDPRGLVTTYGLNGLGNLNTQVSPDTGVASSTYDAAGNLRSRTDAKSQTTTYTYDALNRLTLVSFHDGLAHLYTYDSGSSAVGRLASITEGGASMPHLIQYGYDPRGRVISDTRTAAGIAYSTTYRYDSAGRMDRITYPSGRTVDYSFDSLGRVSAVSTTPFGGSAQQIISGVTYHPFGSVKGFSFPRGPAYARSFDQDGRIIGHTLGATAYAVGYDEASRVNFIVDIDDLANNKIYGYDALDRLTSAILPNAVFGYSYDAVGNRLSKSAAGTTSYTYSPTSNRLAAITRPGGGTPVITHDANGSLTREGPTRYTYDARGRMVRAVDSQGSTTYQVNPLGQRTRKTNSQGDLVFTYDLQGHLIAESDAVAGSTVKEYVWLGDIPVAVVQSTSRYYIYTDHLNTPRLIRSHAGGRVWRWNNAEPFGTNAANDNPQGAGAFEFPLRFAGQYFDKETGLTQNWNRDYWPEVGRYVQSDPIGLRGGVNTYLYAKANPLRYVDPFGLDTAGCDGVPNVFEGPCTLRCCAKHDECFDTWDCTAASWYKNDGCTPGQCNKCNSDVRSCILTCSYNSQHNANWPMYYCAKQHRYVKIPGDFSSQSAAEAACEYDHSKDRQCCTPD